MSKFALLDTPEYKNIVYEMINVTNVLWFDENNNYCYDIKSGLVFEFPCTADAIRLDNKQFIIFDYEDKGITVHTHKNNVDILLALGCHIYNSNCELIESIRGLININLAGNILAKNGDYIDWYLGKVDFNYDILNDLVAKLRF